MEPPLPSGVYTCDIVHPTVPEPQPSVQPSQSKTGPPTSELIEEHRRHTLPTEETPSLLHVTHDPVSQQPIADSSTTPAQQIVQQTSPHRPQRRNHQPPNVPNRIVIE